MSFSNVGRVWTRQSFAAYLATLQRPAWIKGITMHHTGAPCLETRPRGLTIQHIENIADYYKTADKTKKAWSSGPHFFIDEDQIFGMTPPNEPGTHARSFNATHIGIEVLGEYDSEIPTEGRGLECWNTAAIAVRDLLLWLDIGTKGINFHRDDPKTDKTCAGTKVRADWFRRLVMAAYQGELKAAPLQPEQIFDEKFVPAAHWIADAGRSELLKMTQDGLMLGNHRIERSYYDKRNEVTMVSLRELEAWLKSVS